MDAGPIDPAPSVSVSLVEGALAESSDRYTSLFTHHPHASYSVDRRGYYTDVNPVSLALTGLTLDQMKERHFADVVHPEETHLIQDGFDLALAGEPNLVEARVVHTDGQIYDIRCTLIPLVVGGEVVGVHGSTEDITDTKRVLRELEEANARLEEADAAKTLFLANVSHELRTPLASIIAATELMMDVQLEPEPEHFARMVHRNGQRLLALVNDILDFSGLEAHRVALRSRLFDVRAVVEGVAEWAIPLAVSRDLTISFDVDESVPTALFGDSLRVGQVVTNLVQNAITFTAQGGVDVRVTARTAAATPVNGAETPDTWVEFTVTDTGIGIAEDHLRTLMEPFTQVDPTATRGYGGLGLGLAICRSLVDLMGGKLQTISTIGKGSTFTFGVSLGHSGQGNVGEQSP